MVSNKIEKKFNKITVVKGTIKIKQDEKPWLSLSYNKNTGLSLYLSFGSKGRIYFINNKTPVFNFNDIKQTIEFIYSGDWNYATVTKHVKIPFKIIFDNVSDYNNAKKIIEYK